MKTPSNLQECFKALEDKLSLSEQAWFIKTENPLQLHDSFGRWIRNNWGLWDQNSELHKYFKTLGLWHADDMSSVILESFWHHLRNEPLDIDAQIEKYKKYWKENGQTNS